MNQNLQQLRKDLSSSIFGNVGPVFSFRVGPEDASKIAELLSPQWKEEVRDALISLPDYSYIVRRRLTERTWRRDPSSLSPSRSSPSPLCDTNQVLSFMKGDSQSWVSTSHESRTQYGKGCLLEDFAERRSSGTCVLLRCSCSSNRRTAS